MTDPTFEKGEIQVSAFKVISGLAKDAKNVVEAGTCGPDSRRCELHGQTLRLHFGLEDGSTRGAYFDVIGAKSFLKSVDLMSGVAQSKGITIALTPKDRFDEGVLLALKPETARELLWSIKWAFQQQTRTGMSAHLDSANAQPTQG